MTLLTTVLIAAGLSACSNPPARPEHTTPGPATSSLLSLSCPDSAGQQGADHETVVGGVEGLVLPGSDDPAGLYPIGPATGGKRYFIYKTFLAVSASAAPFATVSVTGPRTPGSCTVRRRALASCSAPAQATASSRPRGARCDCPCADRASPATQAASSSPRPPASPSRSPRHPRDQRPLPSRSARSTAEHSHQRRSFNREPAPPPDRFQRPPTPVNGHDLQCHGA